MTFPTHFVGCDVGKTEIVVYSSRDQTTTSLANDPVSLTRFADSLDPTALLSAKPQVVMKPPCLMPW